MAYTLQMRGRGGGILENAAMGLAENALDGIGVLGGEGFRECRPIRTERVIVASRLLSNSGQRQSIRSQLPISILALITSCSPALRL
jgi:hypothetical protein